MAIASTNPFTGFTERRFEPLTKEAIDQKIGRAAEAFADYRMTSFEERAAMLLASADVLATDRDTIAATMTREMGKTIVAARAEVEKCARACRFFAEHAERFLAEEEVDAAAVGARRAYVRYLPIGPVLAVMPWNFPLWQAMRFAAPALMAGNVGLLKHASNVPQTALAMEEIFRRGGFPDGVFQTLLIGSEQVEQVLRDPRVRAATLTGSTPAGRSVASIAGEEIKPTVLELGGSDAFVVMPSADLDRAVATAVTARVQNNGQSCIAAKRFILHEAVAAHFEQQFVERMKALRVGDPMDEATDIGPLALEQVRDDVDALVTDALDKGARLLCGGEIPDGPGWFYPPTIITDVSPGMDLFHEEAFGPVAQLHQVSSLDEAIDLANATDFGLGANAWTEDALEQERFVRDLDAGAVFVNGMVTSFPELPFGGVKVSGYGRELSAHGIREFCNAKTVWVG